MVKLVALYKKPKDVDAFERHYKEVHAPLARKIPGLQRLGVSRFFGAPGGEPRYHMAAVLHFADKDAMFAGLNSPEGKAAAKDLMGFAGDIVHMMFATEDA
ncbi:MAG: EthD family reductase [Phycisphaerae bacterium]